MGFVSCCTKIGRWIPVVFITAVVCWSFYAYVIVMAAMVVENWAAKIAYIIFYLLFGGVFCWSFYQVIYTDVYPVPAEFYLSSYDFSRFQGARPDEQRQILDEFAKDLPVLNRTLAGSVRFCDICQCVKPDRAHHDSVADRCILKMDHYCPWVNNTVGLNNYKFFVMFLFYTLTFCLYVAGTSCQYFVRFWSEGDKTDMSKFHILFVFFIAIMFAFAVTGLLGYHAYLIIKGGFFYRFCLGAVQPQDTITFVRFGSE